jgi:hypothetical protein
MAKFLRVGVHHSNVSGYTSKAWTIGRIGSTVLLKWGSVEVRGVGHGRRIYWTGRPQQKTLRCGSETGAGDYVKMIAGAGAAYLNGGFGPWEFVFTAIVTFCAYKGLSSYHFIGIGWLLHTAWDVMHHLYGNPIVPFAPTSSAGCAITDTVIALWFFAGAPSVFELFSARRAKSA